jgi:hypothetical protein
MGAGGSKVVNHNTCFENNRAVGPECVVLELDWGTKMRLKLKGNLEDDEVV